MLISIKFTFLNKTRCIWSRGVSRSRSAAQHLSKVSTFWLHITVGQLFLSSHLNMRSLTSHLDTPLSQAEGVVVGEGVTFLYSPKQAHKYYVDVYVKSGYVVYEMAVKHIFYYCLYIVAYLLQQYKFVFNWIKIHFFFWFGSLVKSLYTSLTQY